MADFIGAAGFDQSRPQHVEAAKGDLLFARRVGSVTFAHPFQPIRQIEQFLLDFRDQRLSCELPDLLCNRVIIFTVAIPLVAHLA
jgi:hypothetical protein